MKPLTFPLVAIVLALAAPALAGTRTVTTATERRTTTVESTAAGAAARDVDVQRDDATLHERVANALELELGADARNIEFDVEDGVVYLVGYIPTEEHRRRVHDLVHAIAGVKGLEMQELRAMTYFERDVSPQ